jgi:large subunit ribosomal protein L9
MEIILKQDVKNLGYTNDVVKVRNGYGLNFLIPNGFAVLASGSNKKVHAESMKQKAHKLAKIKDDAAKQATSIENVTLTIPMKAGENGKLFGSVTAQNIADVLKKMGHTIDKKQIRLKEDHIKTLGSYTAEVALHKDVKVNVNFEVVEA